MKKNAPGLLIAGAFLVVGLLRLSQYGMHEDSPFHFLRGQAYLQEMLTGKVTFGLQNRPSPVFFAPGQRISLYKPNATEEILSPVRFFGTDDNFPTLQEAHEKALSRQNTRKSFYAHDVWDTNVWNLYAGHPAVSDMLMAVTNRVMYENLGLLGDVESYHLYVVIVASLAVFFVSFFARAAFGGIAAVVASLSLALYPFYFAESHFSIKDIVQMGFFTISLVSFYLCIIAKLSAFAENPDPIGDACESLASADFAPPNEEKVPRASARGASSWRWFILFVLSTFLAFGTKWNIAFLPVIVLPWLGSVLLTKEGRAFVSWPKLALMGVLGIGVPYFLLLIFWPPLRSIGGLVETFHFYKGLAIKDPFFTAVPPFALGILGLNATALFRVLTMTPPVVLLFAVIGIVSLVLKKEKNTHNEVLLLVLWLMVPIARVSRNNIDTTGSMRQFIEFLPALAILAGAGGSVVLSKIKSSAFRTGALIAFCLMLLFPIIRLHPNQNLYFNIFAGGLRGATKSGLYTWQGSSGNVYRQAVEWLNKNAPPGAKLAYMDGTMFSLSPLWLRSDIRFGSHFSGFDMKGEYVISVVYPAPPPVFAYNYLERFLEPLYEIKVDGSAVLKIWQNDKDHRNPSYASQSALEGPYAIERKEANNKKVWELSFLTPQKITRLALRMPEDCASWRVSTKREGIWSVFVGGREIFINPMEYDRGEVVEVPFAADTVEKTRQWDTDKAACLYRANVERVEVVN